RRMPANGGARPRRSSGWPEREGSWAHRGRNARPPQWRAALRPDGLLFQNQTTTARQSFGVLSFGAPASASRRLRRLDSGLEQTVAHELLAVGRARHTEQLRRASQVAAGGLHRALQRLLLLRLEALLPGQRRVDGDTVGAGAGGGRRFRALEVEVRRQHRAAARAQGGAFDRVPQFADVAAPRV